MLFVKDTITKNDVNIINDFFAEFDKSIETVSPEEAEQKTSVQEYINSLVTSQYKKSVEDIASTTIGNKIKRKKSLQQVMQQSFFYGANRFGNNFIA